MLRIILAALASALMITGALSQDGARAYFLLPQNTNIASLTVTVLHSEVGGSAFNAVAVTPSYRRSVDLAGHAGSVLIGIPVGSLSASINTGLGIVDLNTNVARGDLFVGGEVGILGSPSLALMDYAQYKPGLRVSIAARLYAPTGDYDSTRLLNLGGNRWSLQASLPISYVVGESVLDPALTTIEIVPSVQIFGDNNDAFGPATVSSQQPLWALEGHITRNLGQAVWVSVDGHYEYGGQNSADGVPVGVARNSLSVGATLGLALGPSVAARLSYLEQVYSNVPGSVARVFELTTAFSF